MRTRRWRACRASTGRRADAIAGGGLQWQRSDGVDCVRGVVGVTRARGARGGDAEDAR